jgi:hypothetical protein
VVCAAAWKPVAADTTNSSCANLMSILTLVLTSEFGQVYVELY